MNAQQVELYFNRIRKRVVTHNILFRFLLGHDELCNLQLASVYCNKKKKKYTIHSAIFVM